MLRKKHIPALAVADFSSILRILIIIIQLLVRLFGGGGTPSLIL